jgi:hypothetical protein
MRFLQRGQVFFGTPSRPSETPNQDLATGTHSCRPFLVRQQHGIQQHGILFSAAEAMLGQPVREDLAELAPRLLVRATRVKRTTGLEPATFGLGKLSAGVDPRVDSPF